MGRHRGHEPRFAGPGWRLIGAVGGWLVFVFGFTGLSLSAATVLGLGGFCAAGGPYVIETRCPPQVIAFAPGGIFIGLAGVAIGMLLSGGFGASVAAWAWPVLFVGLGIDFAAAAFRGQPSAAFLAVMFIAMGAAPLVFAVRSWGLAPLLRGVRRLDGRRFAGAPAGGDVGGALGLRARAGEEDAATRATPADALLGFGLPALSAAAGAWLAVLSFWAVSGA